jgi:ABC-type nitrate/sulfonate/bicarbonate transport system ATPase subunit
MPDPVVVMEGVGHAYDGREVLRALDLEIRAGEFIAVVGPSGCGKSTILHLVAGRMRASAGRVTVNGRCRTVHQASGLFPWLTVQANVALGLRGSGLAAAQAAREVAAMLDLIGAAGCRDRYPHELSGGLRQRVELARALLGPSEILLLDEPFSALDYLSRIDVRGYLLRLLEQWPRTAVLVTHDLVEAAQLADRILVLDGSPARVADEIVMPREGAREPTDPVVTATVERLLSVLGGRCAPGVQPLIQEQPCVL